MTRQEILTKAIEKATASGWDSAPWNGWGMDRFQLDSNGEVWQYDGDGGWIICPIETFIYQHDFAKALWGDTMDEPFVITDALTDQKHNPWKWHLQQMVISDNPIKYLGENI